MREDLSRSCKYIIAIVVIGLLPLAIGADLHGRAWRVVSERSQLASVLSHTFETQVMTIEIGKCEQAYERCINDARQRNKQVCENNWRQCVSRKCVPRGASAARQCPKDADCESSCTESTSSKGGLLSCCAGGPKHENSCTKSVDAKCNPKRTEVGGVPANISELKTVSDPGAALNVDPLLTQPYGMQEMRPFSSRVDPNAPSLGFIPTDPFALQDLFDRAPAPGYMQLPYEPPSQSPHEGIFAFNNSSFASLNESVVPVTDSTLFPVSDSGPQPEANSFNSEYAGILDQSGYVQVTPSDTTSGNQESDQISSPVPFYGGEDGSTFVEQFQAPAQTSQQNSSLYRRLLGWFGALFR